MNINNFIKEIENLGISITSEQLKCLNIYKDLLIEYNQKFNLTAITEEQDIYLKHFYDSLTINKVIDLDNEYKVLDIGTGAGFPGLVLKIFFPKLDITLIDSNHKKIIFLQEVIKKLELKNIRCYNFRAEDLANEYKENFDIVTSRAVASLRILSELAIPYLKVNGYFIAMKGNINEEIKESESTIKILNSEIKEINEFILPFNAGNRTIIKIEKLSKTDSKYPRKYDQIKKKKL